jgi:hypothetical protein
MGTNGVVTASQVDVNAGLQSNIALTTSSNTLVGGYVSVGNNTLNYYTNGNLSSQVVSGGSITLVNSSANYIVADCSSSTFTNLSAESLIDYVRYYPYSEVYRGGNFPHVQNAPLLGVGEIEAAHHRTAAANRYARESGLDLITAPANVLAVNDGYVWAVNTRYYINAVVNGVTRVFKCFHSGGVWTSTSSTDTTVNNTEYDDGTGLQSLAGNEWVVVYYFRGVEDQDHLYTVYSDKFASAEAARASGVIGNLPEIITSHAMLIGRVIVEQASAVDTANIESVFTTTFTGSTPIVNHNDLVGLQGGSSTDYYHIKSSEYDAIKEETTYPNVNTVVNAGTVTAGAYTDLAALGGTDFTIQEANGASPMEVEFHFSGLTLVPNNITMYAQYSGSAHEVAIEVYNYSTPAWEQVGEMSNTAGKIWYSIPLFNGTNYTSAGTAKFRVRHVSNGVNTHFFYFDYIKFGRSLASGAGVNDHGALLGLGDNDHPQYQLTSATSAITSLAMNTSERNNYFYTSNNTFANSTHSHGAVSLALTNINGTTASASNGLTLSLSVNAGGAGDGGNVIAAGGSTAATTGTIVFSNSNGVSFGLNGATVTAQHNGLTNAGAFLASNVSSNYVQTANTTAYTSYTTQSVQTQNSVLINGASGTFSLAQHTHSHGFGTVSTAGSDLVVGTSNSNGITLGVPKWITTAAAGGGNTLTISGSNGSLQTNGLTVLGSGVAQVYTTTGNQFVVSVPSGGGAGDGWNPIAAGGSTGNSTQSIVFGNANGVSFSLNGSTVEPSHTLAYATHSHGNISLALTNLTGTTASASNGMTLSLSGNAAGGGAAVTVGGWEVFPAGNNTTASSLGQRSLYFQKLHPDVNYSFNNFELRMSNSMVTTTNNSAAVSYTLFYGLYSQDTNNSYNSIATSSMYIAGSMSSSNSAGITVSQGGSSFTTQASTTVASLMSGYKHLYLPFTSTITADGHYAFAIMASSTTTGGTGALRLALVNETVINNLTIGKIYGSTVLASNSTFVGDFGQGVYSATTSALPASVAKSQMSNAVSQARLYIQLDV